MDKKLQSIDKFTYLESTLSRAVHIDDEFTARTVKARVAFGRLRSNFWERNGIRLHTKLKVYKAVVLPTLLHSETCTVYQRHARRLNHVHLSCLRKLLNIRWQDKIPAEEGNDAKRAYSIKARIAKMDLPRYKNA